MNDLSSQLAKQGTLLNQLGFSYKDSASLIGVLDKAGINSRASLSAMQQGLTKLADTGEPLDKAFKRTAGSIQEFTDKGNDAAALKLASKVFGTRGAASFVGALKSGKVNLTTSRSPRACLATRS